MKSPLEQAYRHRQLFQRLTPIFLMLLMALPDGSVPFPVPRGARGRDSYPTLVPVVIIPGTGGNKLEAKLNRTTVVGNCDKTSDWYRIWLNVWDKLIAGKTEIEF